MGFGSTLVLLFVNYRTKQPTVCGWIVTLLFLSVLINVLFSKISRHSTEENDQVVRLDNINPKFRNFPTHLPGKQKEEIKNLPGDGSDNKQDIQPIPIPAFDPNLAIPVFDPNKQHRKKQAISNPGKQKEEINNLPGDSSDDDRDIQPIPIPAFDQNIAFPVFDPNKQHRKKEAIGEDEKNEGRRANVAEHQKPQPKQFPVDVLLRPDITCDQKQSLLMVIFSRPENRGGRSAIRRTWARFSADKYAAAEIRWISIFVIGRARTDWLEEEIKVENDRHHDILQGDFTDSPYEDTRKFMLALKWIIGSTQLSHECKVRYVMKSMDNIFHNMIAISGWLKAKFSTGDKDLYVGRLLHKDAPIRDPDHPLYVSPADYPGQFFPDLIQGPVYLFSYYTLTRMNEAMSRVTPTAMEDAYVGLLAERGGIIPQHNDHFQMLAHIRDGCHFLRMFFIYNILPNDHLVIDGNIEKAQHNKKCAPAKRTYDHVEA